MEEGARLRSETHAGQLPGSLILVSVLMNHHTTGIDYIFVLLSRKESTWKK